MAKTIYLPDGESWTVLGENDAEPSLRRIIQKYLGDDCVELLNDVVELGVENRLEGYCTNCILGE